MGGTPDFKLQGLSSLEGMFMAWKFRHGISSILNFGPGIVWDFDFCTHSIIEANKLSGDSI